MRKTGNPNINTKFYWDNIYADRDRIDRYEAESGELDHPVIIDGNFIYPSKRFSTAVDMVSEGDKVLDIGCGTGAFIKRVLNKYPFNEAWGVDISASVIKSNQERIPDGVFYQQYIGRLDKVPENYFDIVFSGEVIEHLEDPNILFKDAYMCLKEGGKFIITTPNNESVKSIEHVWYVEEDDVRKFYDDNGFKNVEFVSLHDFERAIIIFAIGEK